MTSSQLDLPWLLTDAQPCIRGAGATVPNLDDMLQENLPGDDSNSLSTFKHLVGL
jgi:hypothetical protein